MLDLTPEARLRTVEGFVQSMAEIRGIDLHRVSFALREARR